MKSESVVLRAIVARGLACNPQKGETATQFRKALLPRERNTISQTCHLSRNAVSVRVVPTRRKRARRSSTNWYCRSCSPTKRSKGLDKSTEYAEQMEALKQSVLANAYVEDFIKNNPVTDDMVKAEYDRITATVTGTEYKRAHPLAKNPKRKKSSPN